MLNPVAAIERGVGVAPSQAMTDTVAVVFTPSGLRGEFPLGTPLLEAARQLGVDIDSVCGGRGLCGRCQILCTEGDFPKHGIESRANHLSKFSLTETRFEERKTPLSGGRRLSCHTLIKGPLVIDVPAESQVHSQVIRKAAENRDIALDPDIHLYYIEVPPDDMENGKSELARVREALESDWQIQDLHVDPGVCLSLAEHLRRGNRAITTAVWSDSQQPAELIATWPGLQEVIYGVAIDVGSTTIALHLTNLHTGEVIASTGCMNPQIRFGEDLMSRVSYVMMQPEGAADMTRVVRASINQLINEAVVQAKITSEQIVSMVIAGNTIMHHLLLGYDAAPLGVAPFTLATAEPINMPAREIGLGINPGGRLYIPPCIAGHVGADTTAVMLSEQPYNGDPISLIIDIGTNAEIVLGNSTKLLACSSPTGPAFEGAQISCGQRAAPGAIERVRIEAETLKVRYKVIGSNLWSDETGFEDSIAAHGVTGVCGSGIIEAVAEMYLVGILSTDGVIEGHMKERTSRVHEFNRTFAFLLADRETPIIITQNDVRQIQLAKAALYAGVKLLMDKFPTDTVDEIRIAGAFGSNVDAKFAMVLGLIPDCPLDQVSSVGNAASTGARIALLNKQSRQEIEQVARQVEKIETAVSPDFQEYFINAMAIPHKTDPFQNLFKIVSRPATASATENPDGQPRRRRRRKR
ncbi:MAG: uncharacterized 2Fe-2S/4Fe-4S cluster protein (DUF4445 family) [Planctomycetaceae bacterium]